MRKNNKKRNNFLTSRNISLSDNEIYNFHSVNDYLYKHRNIRRQILTNPTLSPIDSKEQLTFHNSENDDRGKYKIFSTINTSDNLNNNSKELILSKSSRSLSNSNSSKKKISIGKKDNLKKFKEKKNNSSTIINIFNTSVNNTPNIYFFNPMISKNNLNDNSSSSFFLQRNNALYSPVNKKSKKMLTLNMHMFQRLKTIKKKSKDTKPKKQLHRKYTFENIKLNENTKKKIMLEIQLNTNENNINEKEEFYNNYSDKEYNIKRFLTEKQNKNINNLNETKILTLHSLSSGKTECDKIFSKKNSLFSELTDNNLIEEERRKLEDKLNKNFGIIDNEKFQCDLLEKKNIYINNIFNEKYKKINDTIKNQLQHNFTIEKIDLPQYLNEKKLHVLNSGENNKIKVERYYLSHVFNLDLMLFKQKFSLDKNAGKELIKIYMVKETYNFLKENYMQETPNTIKPLIKKFKNLMKLEKILNNYKIFISKNANYIYMSFKFIMHDIQDGILRITKTKTNKRVSVINKNNNNKAFKTLNYPRRQTTVRRRTLLKSLAITKNITLKMDLLKRPLTKRKINDNNNSNMRLKTYYFHRKGERSLNHQKTYVRNLKLRPSIKVQNIKFNIEDPRDAISKNKNMTKEGLIYRTEEIKAEMKKNLKSVEEILFFLIKENNFREFSDILERFHISLESRNNRGSTFLIFAVQCGYDIFVKYLLEKGANINAQDFELNTALHYALSHNNFNFADILLKNGANERLMNNNGLTPWQMMTYRDFNN